MKSLKISPNHRHFATEDGSPFFYLADTAWELFHRCNREEAELYLADRAQKGFTAVQAVALAELEGLTTPNSYGHLPFTDSNPLKPVEEYWRHVDWIVQRANEYGLYMGFLPTWGNHWHSDEAIFDRKNAYEFGRWIGLRYQSADLIWILGGDRPIHSDTHLEIVRAMAIGIREVDNGKHLMTLHPAGGRSSSRFVHNESWLDFNMMQTGHVRDRDTMGMFGLDWEMLPIRPFINGEPVYEAHPNNFKIGDNGWLDQIDVRRELYRAICSGVAGFAYGAHAVWQFWQEPRVPINLPRTSWKDALSLPGASQMQYGKRLFLSRPFFDRQPAPKTFVQSPLSSGLSTIVACIGTDKSWAVVYIPECQMVTIDLKLLASQRVRATYYNPRDGKSVDGGEVTGQQSCCFQPPFDSWGRDWILLLDDPAKNYTHP